MSDYASIRTRLLVWATLSLAVLLTLSVMVRLDWPPLQDLDTAIGRGPQGFTLRNRLVLDILRVVEFFFYTVTM